MVVTCVGEVVIKILLVLALSADAGLRSRAHVPTINIGGYIKLREYLFLNWSNIMEHIVYCGSAAGT